MTRYVLLASVCLCATPALADSYLATIVDQTTICYIPNLKVTVCPSLLGKINNAVQAGQTNNFAAGNNGQLQINNNGQLAGATPAQLSALFSSFVAGLQVGGATTALQTALTAEAQTARQAENSNQIAASSAQNVANAALPKSGGTMTGPMTLASDPVNPLDPVSLRFFNAHASTGASAPQIGTYTVAGAISPSDTYSLVNCASTCTMTLALAGTQHAVVVFRVGAPVTLTSTIDQVSQSIPMNTTGTLKESATLIEFPSLNSYLLN